MFLHGASIFLQIQPSFLACSCKLSSRLGFGVTTTLDFNPSVPAEHPSLAGFASRLRVLMSERGDTQIDLASALEIAPRSVAAYLASEALPQLSTFVRLCERYAVSLDWMAGTSPERAPRSAAFVAAVDDELLQRFLSGEELDGRIQLARRLPPGRLVTQAELDRIAASAPHRDRQSGKPLDRQ